MSFDPSTGISMCFLAVAFMAKDGRIDSLYVRRIVMHMVSERQGTGDGTGISCYAHGSHSRYIG